MGKSRSLWLAGSSVCALLLVAACVGDESQIVPIVVNDGGGGGEGGTSNGADGGAVTDSGGTPTDSGGGGGQDAGVDATVPITVKGRTAQLDNSMVGYPLLAPQVTLKIFDATGKEFDAKSDDDGLFTVANVLPPYDVLVVPTGSTTNVFYQGLRGTSPVLPITDITVQTSQDEVSATYSGTTTYQPPAVGNVVLIMAAQSLARAHTTPGSIPSGAVDGGFGGSDAVEWNHFASENAATFDLYFLHDDSTGPGGTPLNFYGFGSLANVTIHLDGTPAIPLIPVTKPAGSLSVSFSHYTVPPGVTAVERTAILTNGPRVSVPMFDDSSANTDFTMGTPDVNMKLALCGAGHVPTASGTPSYTSGCKGGLPLGASNVTVGLLSIPTLTTPAANAMNVSRTGTFTFDQAAGKQRYMVKIRSKANGVSWTIFTMNKTVTIPSQGPKLDSSTDYEWWVESFGPFDNIDDSLLEDEAFERHDVDRYRTSVTSTTFDTEL